MEVNTVIENILASYGKYGVTKEKLQPMIEDGIKRDLSLQTIYNGLRMSLVSAFGEHEYFTLDDVMEITRESREELELRGHGLLSTSEPLDPSGRSIDP